LFFIPATDKSASRPTEAPERKFRLKTAPFNYFSSLSSSSFPSLTELNKVLGPLGPLYPLFPIPRAVEASA
jgi:hypothetical protein